MKVFIIKILLVLLLSPAFLINISAQYNTPYKKQIKYLYDEIIGNKCGLIFQYQESKKNYSIDFSLSDSLNWNIILRKDSLIAKKYYYPFDIIHQVGLVKLGKAKRLCILVVSATGGNGIITNEFTFINPEYDSLMNVQINYIIKTNNITYNYNQASLDINRSDEIKFLIGLIGEYDMIWYERYKEKK